MLLNSKIYDVTAWLQATEIHILPNILRSKGNQTMKFGQLIRYRNIFLRKSYRKETGRLVPDLFIS